MEWPVPRYGVGTQVEYDGRPRRIEGMLEFSASNYNLWREYVFPVERLSVRVSPPGFTVEEILWAECKLLVQPNAGRIEVFGQRFERIVDTTARYGVLGGVTGLPVGQAGRVEHQLYLAADLAECLVFRRYNQNGSWKMGVGSRREYTVR